ncbi:hypothetical protein Vretimale_16830 [Volvox reticuliferus]|nr:hypothetical protein Vretimale_16830 [Volvox reticuliferus]
MISSYLRVPKGGKPLVQCDFELAMKQLETRLAQLGCKPSRPPGLEWRPGPSPPQEREKPLSRSEARAKALAKTAQHAAAVRDATKPSTTPSNCLRKLMGHEGEITALCWGTDNRTLVSGGTDRHAIVWEISTGRTRHLLTGHRHEVIAIGYTADGRKLITSGEEGTTRVWCADDPEREPPMVLAGDGSLTTVCLYPDSFHAVTCSTDRSVRVWNTWLGARERLLRLRDNVGVILRLSPDGTMLAASGHPPTVWVFKESTLEDLKSMTGHVDRVTSLAWSPDGKLLVTGSRDKNARVWEVATGTCLSTFTGHTEVVTVVCWSPDGRLIATGGEDRTMRVWDVATGFCRRVLSSHGAEVTCLAWSPDGRYVATGCADKLVRVWS